ncbi:mycofactocin system GMC family oxidoreductase MftG [Tsukamurella spumae]|uniref:Mycofactocin system GMC family oxidoreductase MftG n=1 Tax=Tsukamurella spumae TaxID=44753 RepID=A0A846X745_9ACTN|nr:mycofactocin system GMC family oxidoreductase MftG [Tsukamurella spumae]NKY20119.1 mycofactocin system GMC family oxidoreductase MftG [Tsukamurella spumae]
MTAPDVVVIGAGSAGCLVAAHLAHDRTRRVLLLERGALTAADRPTTALTTLPIHPGAGRVLRHPESRGRDVVRGSGIGGSSVVNGGYFLRGHRDDYAPWPWRLGEISAAFDRLEPRMRATPFADDELGETATAFEAYWGARLPRSPIGGAGAEPEAGSWPMVGLNRVRSNRADGHRWTAADAFLGSPTRRPRLERGVARALTATAGRVTGVLTDGGRIDCGEVILAAGTLGSGALLAPLLGPLVTQEHPELLVRFSPSVPLRRSPLLQTVLHTVEGLEIRCYSDDFANYIEGLPAGGVAIGIADMTRPTTGAIRPLGAGAGVELDLGDPDGTSRARMADGAAQVVEMLESAEFAHLVRPGTVTVDAVPGMSSHAWGTVPLGSRTAADGSVHGIAGLRVVDGSVLPGPLRSGPHASVLMTAGLIAERLSS